MTRSDLATALGHRFPQLTAADTKTCLDTLLHAIEDALANGRRIEIRGFGTFSTRIRPPRIARNPKSGKAVSVPAKRVPYFKLSKDVLNRLNGL